MRNLVLFALFTLVATGFCQESLSNESVIKMLKAGISEEVVANSIAGHAGKYLLSPDDLIALKNAGASDRVLAAMISKNAGPAASAVPQRPAARQVKLVGGTPVQLRMLRTVSSETASDGDTVDFEVLEDIKVDDLVVIPRNAPAVGSITDTEHKKKLGRGGKINLRADFVRLPSGERVRIRAVREEKGQRASTTSSVVHYATTGPFGLLVHGKDAKVAAGTEVAAVVDGDQTINMPVQKP